MTTAMTAANIFKPGTPWLGLVHAWFLKIVSVWMSVCLCVCVYVSAPKAINN